LKGAERKNEELRKGRNREPPFYHFNSEPDWSLSSFPEFPIPSSEMAYENYCGTGIPLDPKLLSRKAAPLARVNAEFPINSFRNSRKG
jgi:hypothetical protein